MNNSTIIHIYPPLIILSMDGKTAVGKIVFTYETLFELMRREKSREDLQKIDSTFYNDVAAYLNDKAKSVAHPADNIFAEEDNVMLQKQTLNIKMLLRDLYECREKKIMHIALIKSRTQSSIIDTSALLEEEKQLFNDLLTIFSQYRESILNPLLVKQVRRDEEKLTITLLQHVPKFVGRNLELYGPYDPGAVATIPKELALVLIAKGRAREVAESKLV